MRPSLAFVTWEDRKALVPATGIICPAQTEEIALQDLDKFTDEWGERYATIAQVWKQAVPFLLSR